MAGGLGGRALKPPSFIAGHHIRDDGLMLMMSLSTKAFFMSFSFSIVVPFFFLFF